MALPIVTGAQYANPLPALEARRWLGALAGGIAALYLVLFVALLGKVGPEDQDQFFVFHELQFWNSSFFGIAKQWTPLMCGGLSLAGEPQVPFMSLSMMLAYLCGPFWGLKLATAAYFVAGWSGAYLYAGLWLREAGQRLLAASLFIGNGFFICRFGYGHIDFMPFLTLPLLLWMLHRLSGIGAAGLHGHLRRAVAVALLGALIAVGVDGSPVAIIHLLVWVGLYAAALACVGRSWRPLAILAGALALALLLDAGYLWPMLQAQASQPRLTPDRFTSFLTLVWFALIPMRGKLLPANGLGHELTVYIGPVLAWLVWRERAWLRSSLPNAMRRPIIFVSCVSIVLGMGSLRGLHVPTILSPFDLLRPLPGFRSIGVTGRYWGFLALPLSLCGAAALWRFASQDMPRARLRMVLGLTIFLQLGFQLETTLAYWLPTRTYHAEEVRSPFRAGPQDIRYVARGKTPQGVFITPTQGVMDCYDMDDFRHSEMAAGSALIKEARTDIGRSLAASAFSARFATWSQILVQPAPGSELPDMGVRLVLHQAYHPYWQAHGCATRADGKGNLVLDCPAASFGRRPVDLRFNDPLSALAASVSLVAWQAWLATLALTLLLLRLQSALKPAVAADGGVLRGGPVNSAPGSHR